MFCYQCEQTAKGSGCTVRGVCGKDPETAALQDLLVYAVKGLSTYAHRATQLGVKDREVDVFTVEALFATLTNVNFDSKFLRGLVSRAVDLRDRVRGLYEDACRKAGRAPEMLPAHGYPGLKKYKQLVGNSHFRSHLYKPLSQDGLFLREVNRYCLVQISSRA